MVDVGHSIHLREAETPPRSVPSVAIKTLRGVVQRDATRSVDFTNRQILLLFIVLAAITSIPIVLYPWPPLADYINHLARMHAIATINADPDLARYYEIDWQVIPNLMMDLLVPVFERVMNVYVAGQLYMIMSFVLILSGTMALNRQLYGHWSVLPMISFPLLYNNVFLVGTMNYVFGIGLSLWALATWAAMRERSLRARLGVSALFVLGLFFCHLFALGLYGLGLLAYELYRLGTIYARLPRPRAAREILQAQWIAPLADLVATGLPFLLVLPLLMMSPTWGLRSSFAWEYQGKIDGLISIVEVYSHAAAFLLTGIVAFAAGWGIRHRALKFHPFGYVFLVIGGLVYLAMPRIFFDTFMADQRMPISLAFTAVACAHLNLRHYYVRRGFATVLVLLLAVRVLEVQTVWRDLSQVTSSFRESVRHIERGSKVLVSYADPDAGDDPSDLPLVHADCLAMIERSALVTTNFTVVGKQILHVRPEYRTQVDTADGTPPAIAQLVEVADNPDAVKSAYWKQWTSDFDYLYVLFTDPNYENPDPARLTAIYAGERFVLYQIKPRMAEAEAPAGN